MWRSKLAIICLLLIPCLVNFLSLGGLRAQQMFAKGNERSPIVIKADSLEIDDNRKVVTFSGNVDAKEQQFTIKCDKLLVYYTEQKGGADANEVQLRIEKIIAKGNVNILRETGGRATAEQALYYRDDEKLILTGNPVVRQGKDFVEGSKITLFLRENRSIVEGSRGKKVRAVLFPNRKEGSSIEQ